MESLPEEICYCFMTLTYDKLSNESMLEHGIVDKMVELILSTPEAYTYTSFRTVIHGLANIAIGSDTAKNRMGGELTLEWIVHLSSLIYFL